MCVLNIYRVFVLSLVLETVSGMDSCDYLCTCESENEDEIVTCRGANVTEVPSDLPRNVTELYLSGTAITRVRKGSFSIYPNLTRLFFRDLRKRPCFLETMEKDSLSHLDNLRVIGFIGCERLFHIGPGVFGKFKLLDTLQIYRSGLRQVPDLGQFRTENPYTNNIMHEIDFSSNRIEKIEEHAFMGIKANFLNLNNNRIKVIQKSAFYKAQVVTLQISDNPLLTVLEDGAFSEIRDLKKLDLSRTPITNLPTAGISDIEELILKDTKYLRHFPSVWTFHKIKKAQLYYPHHCCAFRIPEKEKGRPERQQLQIKRAYEEAQRRIHQDCATPPSSGTDQQTESTIPYPLAKRHKRNYFYQDDMADDAFDFNSSSQIPAFEHETFGEFFTNKEVFNKLPNFTFQPPISENISKLLAECGEIHQEESYREVECTPIPDAFNPCEDVMGYEWLRIFVWFVVLAAILGNTVVLLVLISGRKKMTVPKFLMCNLAFADFIMGIYLLLLASIDIHTLGEYFNYAILWQNEGGCQTAGFLTVFSSELSIFTLTVITLERWYAISHAIHLTKRLKLRQAISIMAVGWIYAIVMSMLPLIGISNYGNVSVCLPMKIENARDQAYVISLLVINGVAFLCICCCYINMYWQVRNSDSTARSNDATIAKRMAMLVFTNFVCWAPIAFFGLTASGGIPLIDITNSKILLVFFYPLNSCANPFLYVIITKQFRKDMFLILDKYGICNDKSGKYKLTVSSKSLTQSRKDSLALHNVIHPITSSITHVSGSCNGSKNSLKIGNGGTSPNITPKGTPKEGYSPLANQAKSDGLDCHCDRKLSIVRESNMSSDDFREVTMRYSDPKDTTTPPPCIRSASEYVIFFPTNRKGSVPRGRPLYSHQYSSETYSSSQSGNYTESSCLSECEYGDRTNPWEIREDVITKPSFSDGDTFYPISEENLESIPLNEDKQLNDSASVDDTSENCVEEAQKALLEQKVKETCKGPEVQTKCVHFRLTDDDEGIDVDET